MTHDAHGNRLSAATAQQAARIDAITLGLAGLQLDAALAADALPDTMPGVPMAHILRASGLVMAAEAAAIPGLRRTLADAEPLLSTMTPREQLHLAALKAWAEGDFARAAQRYSALTDAHPRDLLALQVGQQVDFFTGRQAVLRDRPARALQHWSTDLPGQAYLLGMLAFGLEENGAHEQAQAAGEQAVDRNPRDGWAVHAVAHCHEMTGATEAGITWLASQADSWAPGSLLAYHNWWHLALFHHDRQDWAAVLALYDAHLPRDAGAPALELVDAAALLWRLWLAGVDVGDRAARIAAAWDATLAPPGSAGYLVFNDVHAAFARVAAGQLAAADAHLAALERRADGLGLHAGIIARVGLPLVRAVYALGGGDAAGALDLLARHHGDAMAMGGSNAQRDVFALTLMAAAERAGDSAAMLAAARLRLAAKPQSPFARAALSRAHALARAPAPHVLA